MNRKGFTLLEILIVLVILAVLAGLAIPAYTSSIARSKSQEALQSLSATREAMQTYYATNNSYANASLDPASANYIGYNPNSAAAGVTRKFDYTLASAAGTFTATATPTVASGLSGTATINEVGTVTNTIR
jgi:type IV pilus assembly protein PilE